MCLEHLDQSQKSKEENFFKIPYIKTSKFSNNINEPKIVLSVLDKIGTDNELLVKGLELFLKICL